MTPQEITAHHEAGHAVIDLRLGLGVIEVRVYGTRGHVEPAARDYRTGLPDQASEVELVNAWAPFGIGSLAGPAAEARVRGVEGLRDCGSADVAHVEGWLRQVLRDPDNYQSAASWLVEHACWLVDESWDAIGLVAHGLLEHRVLSGEQVAKLVGQD